MLVVRVLLGSAALMVVLAVLFWTGIIDVGIEPWRLALVAGMIAVADLVMAAVFLRKHTRR